MTRRLASPRFAAILVAGSMSIVAFAHWANHAAFERRVLALDATSDRGVAAVAIVAAGVTSAVAAALLAHRRRGVGEAAPLAALSLVLGFLGIDRVTGVHDALADAVASSLGAPHVDSWPTPIVFAPLLLVAATIVWRSLSGPSSRRASRAGLALLAISLGLRPVALVLVLGLDWHPGAGVRHAAVAVQEALEVGGWMIVALALILAVTSATDGPRHAASS